jgi:hypothetical protein
MKRLPVYWFGAEKQALLVGSGAAGAVNRVGVIGMNAKSEMEGQAELVSAGIEKIC